MTVKRPPRMFEGPPLWSFEARLMAAGRNTDVTATSWYRSPLENARVGGDPWSQHQVGWGLDVVGPGQSQFAKLARMTGLTVVQEASHVHVQLFPKGILRRLLG